MTDTTTAYEQFLAVLDSIPWCKQGEGILIAVHKCIPEVLDVMQDHEAKVFPGHLNVKINRSTLHEFRTKHDEGRPVPILFVWRADVVEIWFRTHKSEEFPYDTWSDPKAAAYERECVAVPMSLLGARSKACYQQHVANSKPCPSTIPSL